MLSNCCRPAAFHQLLQQYAIAATGSRGIAGGSGSGSGAGKGSKAAAEVGDLGDEDV